MTPYLGIVLLCLVLLIAWIAFIAYIVSLVIKALKAYINKNTEEKKDKEKKQVILNIPKSTYEKIKKERNSDIKIYIEKLILEDMKKQ